MHAEDTQRTAIAKATAAIENALAQLELEMGATVLDLRLINIQTRRITSTVQHARHVEIELSPQPGTGWSSRE